MQKYGFLHIGKTGGNSVKHIARSIGIDAEKFAVFGHKYTARNIFSEQPDIKIGFVIRDPIDRVVSGFYSRLRQGRPKNQSQWSADEAIAFQYFETLGAMAEALSASDERQKSAALFSMQAISHLRRGYKHHFESIKLLERRRKQFYSVCQIDELDDKINDFFSPLGIAEKDIDDVRVKMHVADYAPSHRRSALSATAEANLRDHLSEEYEIYDWIVAELC